MAVSRRETAPLLRFRQTASFSDFGFALTSRWYSRFHRTAGTNYGSNGGTNFGFGSVNVLAAIREFMSCPV